jgi:hypothetical protein
MKLMKSKHYMIKHRKRWEKILKMKSMEKERVLIKKSKKKCFKKRKSKMIISKIKILKLSMDQLKQFFKKTLKTYKMMKKVKLFK